MSSIDQDTGAANRFYREVRKFSVRTRGWEVAVWHQVTPDEVMDPTLISQRIYGRRDEYLAVMAAAGISSPDSGIPMVLLTLPNESQLLQIKRRTGFESIADYRDNGAPIWAA